MTRIGITNKRTETGIDYSICLNEKSIGRARVIFHNEHEYELSEVEIHQKHRKRGLGKKLVQFVAYHVPHHQLFLATVIPEFYDGISPFMNNQLGKRVVDHYPFINREQDWGIPGLRTSKCSYRPVGQIRKYAVKL